MGRPAKHADGSSGIYDYHSAAQALGVSEYRLRRMVRDREIGYSKSGHIVRFSRAHLDEWMRRNEVKPIRLQA